MAIIRARVTVASVDGLNPGDTLHDTGLAGFGVRARGKAKSYFVRRRINGRLEFFTIGQHGDVWRPEFARQKAVELLRNIAGGESPAEAKREARAAKTFEDVQRLFMLQHGPKLKESTRAEYRRMLDVVLIPRFKSRRLQELARIDMAEMHAELAYSPAQANFALAVMSKIFSWAQDNGFDERDGNPCRRVGKYKIQKRERFLTDEEYGRVGAAVGELTRSGEISQQAGAAIVLLMLTGARKTEILTLQWAFVDFQRSCLFLPDSKTGKKTVRLGEAAIKVLKAIHRVEGNPYVLVGGKNNPHLVNLKKPWQLVLAAAKLESVRIHDLRHSYASVAADSGESLPVIGGLLGHASPQTTARYVHLVDSRLQDANAIVDRRISKAMAGRSCKRRSV